MEVKLLLSEYSTCGEAASYGAHHPSATTCPCRTSMKLCIASRSRSAASTNARTPADETPWRFGRAARERAGGVSGGAGDRQQARR